MLNRTVYYSTDPAILADKFFEGLDIKNLLKQDSFFQPFRGSSQVDYPLDSWFNEEFLVFEIPVLKAKANDIEITKTADTLRIKFTRSDKESVGKKTYIKKGLALRDFDLQWRITSKFDPSGIQSVFEDGLLTIYIPFAKEAIPEKVPILATSENWKKVAMGESLDKQEMVYKGEDENTRYFGKTQIQDEDKRQTAMKSKFSQ